MSNPPSILDPFSPSVITPGGSNGTIPSAVQAQVMTVTPAIARDWASLNTRNRRVRRARVAQLARDMAAGKWILNGETIKIATDGTILDGQHRIYACIEAEIPFETVVIRGLPMDAQDTIDTGLTRSMADQFALREEQHTVVLASIARWVFKWQLGIRAGTDRGRAEPTHAEMLTLLETEPRLREAAAWADSARRVFRSVNGAVYGTAWYLFGELDAEGAEKFLGKVLTGEDMSAGDPALAFRTRIWRAREAGEGLTANEQLAYLIFAWNAFREGRAITRLRMPALTAKNFPEPK